jgi:hypothetical protein
VADFTTLNLRVNTGTQASPVWTAVPAWGAGTGQELRFSDLSNQGSTASASWPFTTRPTSGTSGVDYLYVFSADTTSLGAQGTSSSTPAAFSNANYNLAEINWDNAGTFASAPILTAYSSNAHGAATRGDGSLLGGHASDTGGTARSYLKANMFGRVVSAGAPAAAPSNAPAVTDGTTGTVSPTAGANWLTNYQGLQADNDYITAAATPAATTADQIRIMLRPFMGANVTPGTYVNSVAIKYTWT